MDLGGYRKPLSRIGLLQDHESCRPRDALWGDQGILCGRGLAWPVTTLPFTLFWSMPMLRRSLSTTRLRGERLEVRCNLSAISPLANDVVVTGASLTTMPAVAGDVGGVGDDILIGGEEGFEAQSPTIASSGYIRVKKLNSGG
jgi:hypothetical protein